MEKTLKIEAFIPGEERPENGELTFVDNAIDKTTGTITIKGTFANKEKRLVPGQFVNVVLTLTVQSRCGTRALPGRGAGSDRTICLCHRA